MLNKWNMNKKMSEISVKNMTQVLTCIQQTKVAQDTPLQKMQPNRFPTKYSNLRTLDSTDAWKWTQVIYIKLTLCLQIWPKIIGSIGVWTIQYSAFASLTQYNLFDWGLTFQNSVSNYLLYWWPYHPKQCFIGKSLVLLNSGENAEHKANKHRHKPGHKVRKKVSNENMKSTLSNCTALDTGCKSFQHRSEWMTSIFVS